MQKWPVYLSLGYIDLTIRSKPSAITSILVAFLSVPLKYDFQVYGKPTAMKKQQTYNWESSRKVFKLIFRHLKVLVNNGKLMICVDSQMQQCYPVICTWTANYCENIHLHSFQQPPHCSVYKAPPSLFGEGNSWSWQLRDYWIYFQKMILPTQGYETESRETRQYLEHRAVGIFQGNF